ncbi:MAG: rhomboid family intramembrane serine protease, partial [Bacteroidota bacterium]
MFIPIGDDQVRGGHRPIFSYGFIALNVLIFFYELSLGADGQALNDFFLEYGSIPARVQQGEDWYTLFTSMFLHGDWMHLIG